jgi:hypothetical protein
MNKITFPIDADLHSAAKSLALASGCHMTDVCAGSITARNLGLVAARLPLRAYITVAGARTKRRIVNPRVLTYFGTLRPDVDVRLRALAKMAGVPACRIANECLREFLTGLAWPCPDAPIRVAGALAA